MIQVRLKEGKRVDFFMKGSKLGTVTQGVHGWIKFDFLPTVKLVPPPVDLVCPNCKKRNIIYHPSKPKYICGWCTEEFAIDDSRLVGRKESPILEEQNEQIL